MPISEHFILPQPVLKPLVKLCSCSLSLRWAKKKVPVQINIRASEMSELEFVVSTLILLGNGSGMTMTGP